MQGWCREWIPSVHIQPYCSVTLQLHLYQDAVRGPNLGSCGSQTSRLGPFLSMRMATRPHIKPCRYVSHVERWHQSPATSWGLIILAQFAIPWGRWAGHCGIVAIQNVHSTKQEEHGEAPALCHLAWPVFVLLWFLLSASGPLPHLCWEEDHVSGYFTFTAVALISLPSDTSHTAEERVEDAAHCCQRGSQPGTPTSCPGNRQERGGGTGKWWGVSALGTLSHTWGRTRTGKESQSHCRFESVSGVVCPHDRNRFHQRMSSTSSELSIFSPAGAPIWVEISGF